MKLKEAKRLDKIARESGYLTKITWLNFLFWPTNVKFYVYVDVVFDGHDKGSRPIRINSEDDLRIFIGE